jgi:hypothetical protein
VGREGERERERERERKTFSALMQEMGAQTLQNCLNQVTWIQLGR